MAKAQFHQNQRVWVESVGAWSHIEKIVPIWAKGFDEPVRITYDVGLGRDFLAHELLPEDQVDESLADAELNWRLMRAKNKWQQAEDCQHHPHPGTYPVVVTDPQDWGGWRTPGAEYDRDPRRIEAQARLIVSSPKLMRIASELVDLVGDAPDDAPQELQDMAVRAAEILRYIAEAPAPPPGAEDRDPAANAA